LLILPYPFVGWLWFAALWGDALRVHGWWFVLPCVVGWCLTFAVAGRLVADDRLRRYRLVQAMIPTATDAAYRAGVTQVPRKSTAELEAWLMGHGIAVEHKPTYLLVTKLATGEARLSLPASGEFGGGEPFELHTDQARMVEAMAALLGQALGELRWQLVDAGIEGSAVPDTAARPMVGAARPEAGPHDRNPDSRDR
jgi:hypothetical protein